MLGMDGLRLHATEEALSSRIVRGLRARRPRQAVPFHEFQPSGAPVMAAAVGMY